MSRQIEETASGLANFPCLNGEADVVRALAQQALRPTEDILEESVACSVARLVTAFTAVSAENVRLKAESIRKDRVIGKQANEIRDLRMDVADYEEEVSELRRNGRDGFGRRNGLGLGYFDCIADKDLHF